MKTVRDALQVYRELSFSDRLIFYTTLSSNLDPDRNTLTEFLEEARPIYSKECCYCKGSRIVRNGHRKDGTQRFLCRDCRRSFTLKTDSFVSGSHKHFGIWQKYLSFLQGVRIKARHKKIRQVRIMTGSDRIRILLLCEQQEAETTKASGCMGIDPGVNNLLALSMDTGAEPVLINGRPLKSINQYYNRKRAKLASDAMKIQGVSQTNRIRRLTEKRNRKVKDYLHKASRMVVRTSQEQGIGTIVIGRAIGWKQQTDMYKQNNQNFTAIPHWKLIQMICYKAELAGIRVVIVDEKYTSETSYHDC